MAGLYPQGENVDVALTLPDDYPHPLWWTQPTEWRTMPVAAVVRKVKEIEPKAAVTVQPRNGMFMDVVAHP